MNVINHSIMSIVLVLLLSQYAVNQIGITVKSTIYRGS